MMRRREKERWLNHSASGEEKSDGNAKGKRRAKGTENGNIDREREVNMERTANERGERKSPRWK